MPDYLGPILGFIVGWGLFELTDFRKRWIHRRNLRKALIGELKSVEVVLSATLITFSYGIADPSRAVAEMRWYHIEGRKRRRDLSFPEELSQKMVKQTDEELGAFLKAQKLPYGNRPVNTPFPVLEGILSAQGVGLSEDDLQMLSDLQRQGHFLTRQTQLIDEYARMTFTVTDPRNLKKVFEAHENYVNIYRDRVEYALDVLRLTLEKLTRPSRFTLLITAAKTWIK